MRMEPLSQDTFSMPLLDEAAINRRRGAGSRLNRILSVVSFATLAVMFYFGLRSLSDFDGVSRLKDAGAALFAALLATAAFGDLFIQRLLARLELVPGNYDWLEERYCDRLADLCERYPGLVAYRDQVREAGRRFTSGEYEAMREFASVAFVAMHDADQKAREHAGCQRLYGLASDIAAEPATEIGLLSSSDVAGDRVALNSVSPRNT